MQFDMRDLPLTAYGAPRCLHSIGFACIRSFNRGLKSLFQWWDVSGGFLLVVGEEEDEEGQRESELLDMTFVSAYIQQFMECKCIKYDSY